MRTEKAPDNLAEPMPPQGPRTKHIPKGKLPMVWTPKFLDKADKRIGLIQAVQRRIKDLEADTGADSVQKKLLVSRAAFLTIVLESMEVRALEEGKWDDLSIYTASTNTLVGLLRTLGLERHCKQASLRQYLASKEGEEAQA